VENTTTDNIQKKLRVRQIHKSKEAGYFFRPFSLRCSVLLQQTSVNVTGSSDKPSYMEMQISVPKHTRFFDGYLDAVGRVYTTDKLLYGLSAQIIPKNSSIEALLNAKIIYSEDIKEMTVAFEKSVSDLLKSDPRERLVFYMVEYFSWFEEYTHSCECTSVKLAGKDIPSDHIGYSLKVNDKYNVLVFLYISEKKDQYEQKERLFPLT